MIIQRFNNSDFFNMGEWNRGSNLKKVIPMRFWAHIFKKNLTCHSINTI
jgi:hypothetical protein